MKAKTNTVLIVVALLAYWVGLCNASAFYDPSMQRWLNRDPLGDFVRERLLIPRVEKMEMLTRHAITPFEALKEADLYSFVENNSIISIDPLGLDRFSCCADCGRNLLNNTANCGKTTCALTTGVFTGLYQACIDINIAIPGIEAFCAEEAAEWAIAAGTAYETGCVASALLNYIGCYTKCIVLGHH